MGAAIAIGLLSSCQKDNDWNLNSAPAITLTSIDVTSGDSSYTLTEGWGSVLFDPNSSVKLNFTASSKNVLEQVSFHDGTWGGNMSLIAGSDTTAATPPNSKHRIANNQTEFTYSIYFESISAKTVFSMFVIDENGMSGDFEYIIDVKENFPTIMMDSVMTKRIVNADSTITSWYKNDTVTTTASNKDTTIVTIEAKSIASALSVDADSEVKFYFSSTSANIIDQITYQDGAGNAKLVVGDVTTNTNTTKTTYSVLKDQKAETSFSVVFDKVSSESFFSLSVIDDHRITTDFDYTIKVNVNVP